MNRFLSLGAMVLSACALIAVLFTKAPEPAEVDPFIAEDLAEARELLAQWQYERGEAEERAASVDRAISTLQLRVSALERTAVAAPGAVPSGGAARELQSLRGDVDALLAGDALNTEAGVERMKEVVRAVQGEAFADRARQRAIVDEQVRTERFGRFVQEARLSATQERDLKKLLDDERERRTALFEQGREGQRNRREVSVEARQLRQQTDEAAKRLLSGDQIEQFDAMRSGDRHGGRRGAESGGRRGQMRGGATR